MAKIRAFSVSLLVALVFFSSSAFASVAEEEDTVVAEVESVVTLDHTNFTEFIKKHDFVVVEFYAPWCGHCKKLAPEYEKAATILKGHDPVIVLAKVDANEELNKDLATEYDVKGFPTLKILKKGGESAHEYKGPRDADGIVEYLKKQSGPASVEIKSSEDATSLIGDKKIFIVGIFSEFSGEAFENFTKIADKMRGDYEFGHTLDAKLLPRGDSKKGSLIRLFKPFDELTLDFHIFDTDAVEKFVEESSIPLVTFFNKDPDNHPFVIKFFNTQHSKAMLFVNVTAQTFEDFKAKYQSIAEEYKGQGLGFLLGDVEASQGAFQYFGLKEDQVPLVIIQKTDGEKYLKEKVEPEQLAAWIKDFKEGVLKPFRKSEPIPEVNDQPVKVVVADNLQDMVLKSGKNVLLEFYAPWCGHCKKLAPILDEVALSFESDADVVITKMDATANDFPADVFEVQGYPTLFLYSSTGNLVPYDGSRTKEDIIEFIQKNRDGGHATPETTDTEDVVEPVKDEAQPESVKDEL